MSKCKDCIGNLSASSENCYNEARFYVNKTYCSDLRCFTCPCISCLLFISYFQAFLCFPCRYYNRKNFIFAYKSPYPYGYQVQYKPPEQRMEELLSENNRKQDSEYFTKEDELMAKILNDPLSNSVNFGNKNIR